MVEKVESIKKQNKIVESLRTTKAKYIVGTSNNYFRKNLICRSIVYSS